MKLRLLLGSTIFALACSTNQPTELTELSQPIVNGKLATKGQFNAVGLLFFGNSLCTGTLLDVSDVPGASDEDVNTWVITASHCTIESDANRTTFNVGNGNPDGFSGIDPADGYSQSIQAKKLFTHPKFIAQGGLPQFFRGNDVALVQLSEPVNLDLDGTPGNDDDIVPVPFNRVDLSTFTTPSTSASQVTNCDITKNCFTVVGFGDTVGNAGDAGAKRFVNIILEGLDNEHINFGNFNHGGGGPNGNGSGNTCQGDSGGPSFMEIDGELRVIAVTSGGAGGCIGDSFSQRTDTDKEEFLDLVIGGTFVPQIPCNPVSDGECNEICGYIGDPDCHCQRDGFCEPNADCAPGVRDPDCGAGNNVDGTGCPASVMPSNPNSSTTLPIVVLFGLFGLSLIISRRTSRTRE